MYQHAGTDGKFFETVGYLHFPLRRLRCGQLPELPPSGACHAYYFSMLYIMSTGRSRVLCVVAGRWQDPNKSTFGAVREILEAHKPEARDTKLDGLWAMFIEWHRDDVLLCHPNYRPREGESKLVYRSPIMNISTAAHDDVGKIMERIAEELIFDRDMKAVLCVGNQQTFSRMWHLNQKQSHPSLILLYAPDGARSFSRPSASYDAALTDN